MPFYKRKYTKKKTATKKKKLYKFNVRRRVPRPIRNIYKFKRTTFTINGGTSTSSTGILSTGAYGLVVYKFLAGYADTQQYFSYGYNFQFQDITNNSEFTQLFDRYKLYGVSFKIFPYTNDPNTGSASAVGGINVLIHSAYDKDDSSPPTANEAGIDVLRQYPSYRVQNMAGKRCFKKFIKLSSLTSEVNSAGTYQGNRVVKAGWTDCANITVPHYGLKMIMEFFSSSNVEVHYAMKFEIKYYFCCADPR